MITLSRNSTKRFEQVPLAWYKEAGSVLSNPVKEDDGILKKSAVMIDDC